jgi:hypothetical protein
MVRWVLVRTLPSRKGFLIGHGGGEREREGTNESGWALKLGIRTEDNTGIKRGSEEQSWETVLYKRRWPVELCSNNS